MARVTPAQLQRRRTVMAFLTAFDVRLHSTFSSQGEVINYGAMASFAAWGRGSRLRGAWRPSRTLDYAGASFHPQLHAWGGRVKSRNLLFSDHIPVHVSLETIEVDRKMFCKRGPLNIPQFSATGWRPATDAALRDYRLHVDGSLLPASALRAGVRGRLGTAQGLRTRAGCGPWDCSQTQGLSPTLAF